MEPVRGGSLAVLTDEIRDLFKKENNQMSVASWAIRFAASCEGVITVLSGMSNLEQLRDNISYMENFTPLSDSERDTVMKAAEILKNTPTIPCTSCKYCVEGCPVKINIPSLFGVYNKRKVYGNKVWTANDFAKITKDSGKPSDCIGCRACESVCPQHIEISELMQELKEEFE